MKLRVQKKTQNEIWSGETSQALVIFWVQQINCLKNTFFWLAPPNKTFSNFHEKYRLASNTMTFSVSKIRVFKGGSTGSFAKTDVFSKPRHIDQVLFCHKNIWIFQIKDFRILKFGRYHNFQIWNLSALYDNNLSKLRVQKKTQNEICSGKNSKFGDFLGLTKKVLQKHLFLT